LKVVVGDKIIVPDEEVVNIETEASISKSWVAPMVLAIIFFIIIVVIVVGIMIFIFKIKNTKNESGETSNKKEKAFYQPQMYLSDDNSSEPSKETKRSRTLKRDREVISSDNPRPPKETKRSKNEKQDVEVKEPEVSRSVEMDEMEEDVEKKQNSKVRKTVKKTPTPPQIEKFENEKDTYDFIYYFINILFL
jgi:cell division protein FtsN